MCWCAPSRGAANGDGAAAAAHSCRAAARRNRQLPRPTRACAARKPAFATRAARSRAPPIAARRTHACTRAAHATRTRLPAPVQRRRAKLAFARVRRHAARQQRRHVAHVAVARRGADEVTVMPRVGHRPGVQHRRGHKAAAQMSCLPRLLAVPPAARRAALPRGSRFLESKPPAIKTPPRSRSRWTRLSGGWLLCCPSRTGCTPSSGSRPRPSRRCAARRTRWTCSRRSPPRLKARADTRVVCVGRVWLGFCATRVLCVGGGRCEGAQPQRLTRAVAARTTLCAFPRAAIQFGAFYLWATANGPLNLLAVPPARLALCAVLGAAGQARRCRATQPIKCRTASLGSLAHARPARYRRCRPARSPVHARARAGAERRHLQGDRQEGGALPRSPLFCRRRLHLSLRTVRACVQPPRR